MFYRRLEFGLTVREPSHYLNASRAPHRGGPGFLWGPYRGSTYASRGSQVCGQSMPGWLRYLGAVVLGSTQALEVLGGLWCYLGAVLGRGWWLVCAALPLLALVGHAGWLTSFALVSWCATWYPSGPYLALPGNRSRVSLGGLPFIRLRLLTFIPRPSACLYHASGTILLL